MKRRGFHILLIPVFTYFAIILNATLLVGKTGDDDKISLSLRETPLRTALQLISQQTKTDLVYSDELVAGIVVSCEFTDLKLQEALAKVLQKTPISFTKTSETQVVLFAKISRQELENLPAATIKGRVMDEETNEPLEDVNVFIANSMMGSATNKDGEFIIPNVPFGTFDLVVSRIGYALQKSKIVIAGLHDKTLVFRLTLKPYQAPEIMVAANDMKKWRKKLKKFTKLLLSTTQNASECTILNPHVLDFPDEKRGVFKAVAAEPLIIENKALGYKLYYFLAEFENSSKFLKHRGILKFEELTPQTTGESQKWMKNRRRAYYGSFRHFLTVLCKNYDAPIEDTKILARIDAGNKSNLLRTTYSIIFANNSKLNEMDYRKEMARVIYEGFNVLLAKDGPLMKGKKELIANLVNTNSFLRPAKLPNERLLSFPDYLHVTFTKEFEEDNYLDYIYEVDRGSSDQKSYFKLNANPLLTDSSGRVYNPYGAILYGYWAWERVAEKLPFEYQPTTNTPN